MGSTYKCKCPAGYQGRHCEFSATSCQDSPCQNGGTCSQVFQTYQCNCKPGFTGVNCEQEINECTSNPCLNGKFLQSMGLLVFIKVFYSQKLINISRV